MSLSFIVPTISKLNSFTKSSVVNLCRKLNVAPLFNYTGLQFYSQSQLIYPLQGEVLDSKGENKITKDVIKTINEQLSTAPSRAFAVIQVCGKQFKVTTGDAIVIEGYWPPDVGDKLRLEKVLLAGSKEFSLIGTPLVQSGLVNVNATVIEKALSHTKTHFRKKRRKQYTNINFYRCERTVLRINEVEINHLNEDI